MTNHRSRDSQQGGFSLIEVMVAITLLSIGILTLVAAFASSVASTQNAEQNLIARQKALQAMESIFTARNTQQITFAQINNIPSGGIFTLGATPMWSAGPDGLVNTADDVPFPANGVCPAGPECFPMPGPDGILGTPDDVPMSLANFTRSITIAPVLQADGVTVNPNLRQITVTVTYQGGTGEQHNYTVLALISSFR